MRDALEAAFPLLAKLVPADYGALCVSRSDRAGDYDWMMVDFPVDWFNAYAEMAPHDFVRAAVTCRPNEVLRDSEMIPRAELERNMMYRRAKELRVPLEHVMSVMITFGGDWHAGLNLYRGHRRAFSDRDREILQRFTPSFAATIRNCKLFGDALRKSAVVESILCQRGYEVVILARGTRELVRTEGVTQMLARWFAPIEMAREGLPSAILDHLELAIRHHGRLERPVDPYVKLASGGRQLEVSVIPAPYGPSETVWVILMKETGSLPDTWRGVLTPKEQEVAARVARGWDNRLIADDLRCEVATVKKHLQRVFDKLGISSRSALCHLATKGG